jgi:hypothetical protein
MDTSELEHEMEIIPLRKLKNVHSSTVSGIIIQDTVDHVLFNRILFDSMNRCQNMMISSIVSNRSVQLSELHLTGKTGPYAVCLSAFSLPQVFCKSLENPQCSIFYLR